MVKCIYATRSLKGLRLKCQPSEHFGIKIHLLTTCMVVKIRKAGAIAKEVVVMNGYSTGEEMIWVTRVGKHTQACWF